MAIKVIRGESDAALKSLTAALRPYQKQHPGANIDMYRQSPASIRVRVVDSGFAKLGRSARHKSIWKHLRKLPEDIRSEISMLVLLTPDEMDSSFANVEFDDPVPSKL